MSMRREINDYRQRAAKQYPIVAVLGPRQSGKTTLVKHLFKDYDYTNLEEPDMRELAQRDPRTILSKYPKNLIIDEVQRVPGLLSYIQVAVDESEYDGIYILTGSHQLEHHEAMSQSLAGRTALLELLPLSLTGLSQAGFNLSVNQQMLMGFYPRITTRT